MVETPRSTIDRPRSVNSRSPQRAQYHLLSPTSRREPGESRASTPRSAPGYDPELTAGRPELSDIPALVAATRFPLDLARRDHSASWLADHAIRERLRLFRGNVRMLVSRRAGGLAAAAAFRVLAPDWRWQLEALVACNPEDGAALDEVLRAGVKDAGEAGARRVLARMPGDLTVDSAMRRAAFVPFVTEFVYVLADDRPVRPSGAPYVRRVHPADVWGIHQLYLDVVPRQVQYAEAVTSRTWERSRPLRPGTRRSSGWVIEDHGRIRGYARVSTEIDPGVVRIDLLIDPLLRTLAPDLISAVVSEAQQQHGMPCVVVIPGYAQELHQPVQEAGFMHVGDQTAWVCYTTVPARSYIVAVDLGVPAAAEAQRARVPGLGGAGMSVVGPVEWGKSCLPLVGPDHGASPR